MNMQHNYLEMQVITNLFPLLFILELLFAFVFLNRVQKICNIYLVSLTYTIILTRRAYEQVSSFISRLQIHVFSVSM